MNTEKETEKTTKKGGYTLTAVDRRFLGMVDVIVAKNKQAGIKPDTDGGLSRVVFNDRTLVSKMRSSHRGISVGQIAKFVAFFGLDANLLFSDTGKLFYNPGGKEAPAGNREVNNTRVEGNNHGSVTGKIKVNGDLVNGDKVGTIIQHARHIINNEFSKEHKDAFQEILDRIWDEARELERKVEEKGAFFAEPRLLARPRERREQARADARDRQHRLRRLPLRRGRQLDRAAAAGGRSDGEEA